jgi:hypothetical protein
MVFFAITRRGYESHRALGAVGVLWLCDGVISDEELVELRGSGVNVSVFDYRIEPHETDILFDAVETIKEHHPGEQLWIES